MHRCPAFLEGKGYPVNCAGHAKSMEIDRMCISENPTYGDHFVA